eukprot:snap_masked-scaffold_2-processed-gene-4.43-mRNA-1 protein AED:1.00 eAED:1.00 QI:0/0/0/0/1/1/2/0/89
MINLTLYERIVVTHFEKDLVRIVTRKARVEENLCEDTKMSSMMKRGTSCLSRGRTFRIFSNKTPSEKTKVQALTFQEQLQTELIEICQD